MKSIHNRANSVQRGGGGAHWLVPVTMKESVEKRFSSITPSNLDTSSMKERAQIMLIHQKKHQDPDDTKLTIGNNTPRRKVEPIP